MPQYPELRGRNVLITGGANGIGAAIVRAFNRHGAHVFFCDTDEAAGVALAGELGAETVFTRVDLTREREVCRWIGRVRGRVGTIHCLVNNAARDPRLAFEKSTAKFWDDLFAINLRAYFLCAREACRAMSRDSSIINLSSITFHSAPVPMSAYVATKGGVLGFTRSLARELGPERIRVNAVSPGWIMTERQLEEFVTPTVKRLIRRSQSIPDLIGPEEIAEVVLFLAGDGSRAITGQEILADRGWHHS